jgi:hypothetical protein
MQIKFLDGTEKTSCLDRGWMHGVIVPALLGRVSRPGGDAKDANTSAGSTICHAFFRTIRATWRGRVAFWQQRR